MPLQNTSERHEATLNKGSSYGDINPVSISDAAIIPSDVWQNINAQISCKKDQNEVFILYSEETRVPRLKSKDNDINRKVTPSTVTRPPTGTYERPTLTIMLTTLACLSKIERF